MLKRYIVKNNKSNIILFDDTQTIDTLKNTIMVQCKLKNKDFFLTYNDKLLKETRNTNSYNIENYGIIQINFRQRGGFAGLIIALAAVTAILSVLAKPLISLIKIMGKLLILFFEFMGIFPHLFDLVLLIFDPRKFIDDLIFGVSYGIITMFNGIFSSIYSGSSSIPNKDPTDTSGVHKVCVSPSLLNLILLIVCPPLALFIDMGFTFYTIFLVIVCAILTIKLYYFPGLIFAALHILC